MLDSKKTGLLVRPNILADDARRFGHKQPECLRLVDEERPDLEYIGQGKGCPKRSSKLPRFVLDELLEEGKRLGVHYLGVFERATSYSRRRPQDPDLPTPWTDAKTRSGWLAERGCLDFKIALDSIEKHVKLHVIQWRRACGNSKGTADFKPPSPQKTRSSHRDDTPDQLFKDVSRSFADGPADIVCYDSRAVAALRASYAYSANPKFAFSVAFYDLCKIKSAAAGAAPYVREFVDMLAMPSSARRILMQKASGL